MHKAEFEPVSLCLDSRDNIFAMTPWTGDQPISRPLHSNTGQRRHTSRARVGFECTKPVSKRSGTPRAQWYPAASVVYFTTLLASALYRVELREDSERRMSRWHRPCGPRHEISSPIRTMGSCVRTPLKAIHVCVYSVFVLGWGLATGWSSIQGVLLTV
jgi:hypothetical protein